MIMPSLFISATTFSPNSVSPPWTGLGSPEASAQSVAVQWVSVISRTPARWNSRRRTRSFSMA